MGFTDSFNSSLRAGATLQNILYQKEARDQAKEVNGATEGVRKLEAIRDTYGDDMESYPQEALSLLRDTMNEHPDLMGKRPGGQPTVLDFHKTGQGVAASVRVDDGNGNVSEGPITKKGTSDDDDEVVTIQSMQDGMINPILANLKQFEINARGKSAAADKQLQTRNDARRTNESFETLNSAINSGPADPQSPLQAPAPQNAPTQPAPAIEEGPAQGLRSAAVTSPGPQPPSTPQPTRPYGQFNGGDFKTEGAQDVVIAAAQENGIDPDLFQAVTFHESAGGDVNAQSPTGASGLGQMTGIAVKEVNRIYGTNYTREQMRTDPKANADASAKLLAYELKQHDGNVEQALAAYNGGRTALKKAGGDYTKMRPETAAYPGKVLALLSGSSDAQAAEPQGLGAGYQSKRQYAGTPEQDAYRPVPQDVPAIHADQEPDLSQGTIARDRTTPPSAPSEQGFVPKGEAQKKVAAEVEAAPEPESEEEVVKAAQTVQGTKPAQKWTKEQRKALYTLHRLNPAQFPIDKVVSALETGRMSKKEWKTFQNAVGQTIKIDEDGNQTVLADTPENKAFLEAKTRKLNYETNTAAVKDAQATQDKQLAQTKARTEFAMEQSVNIHGGDPQRMAQHRDMYNTTANTMGLNLDAQETPTVINKAAKLQKDLADETGSAWFNFWQGPDYEFSDYSAGMTILNAPGNPYSVESQDKDVREDAAEWVKDNYFDPVRKQFPDMEPSKQAGAAYAATWLAKQGMSTEDAIRVAGTISSNGNFANPAQVIEAVKVQLQKGK